MHVGPTKKVIVIGAGAGGLAAAIDLARMGFSVQVLEKSSSVGGKMRQVYIGNTRVDVGPTVLTMRWVFDELAQDAQARLEDFVSLEPATILARHAFQDGSRLDLFSDLERSRTAIERFSNPKNADGYARYAKYSAAIFDEVLHTFLTAQKPGVLDLLSQKRHKVLQAIRRVDATRIYRQALASFFNDPRLLQLFGRYTTYCGSSPFSAPATLNVIAHVERQGVWRIPNGGMHELARALAALATSLGAGIEVGVEVASIELSGRRVCGVRTATGEYLNADAVVWNGEPQALAAGLAGDAIQRHCRKLHRSNTRASLSAYTFAVAATVRGMPLSHHNVLFARYSQKEFEDLFIRRRLPDDPTVYICAPQRAATDKQESTDESEALFCLINAPAITSSNSHSNTQQQAWDTIQRVAERCGLALDARPNDAFFQSPYSFAERFPASAGSLYGAVTHGMKASFARPSARTPLQGLYLAGGSVHPGAGVPMAALSGRLAAQAIAQDHGLANAITQLGRLASP